MAGWLESASPVIRMRKQGRPLLTGGRSGSRGVIPRFQSPDLERGPPTLPAPGTRSGDMSDRNYTRTFHPRSRLHVSPQAKATGIGGKVSQEENLPQ